MKSNITKKISPYLILAAACCFSIGGICIKLIPWSGMAISGARCLISCPIVFIYARLIKHKIVMSRGVWLGAAALAIDNILITVSNKLTAAANVIILQYTAPVFIIIFSFLFLKKKPGKLDIVTTCFVLAGAVLFVIDGLSTGGVLGNILSLIAGASYAIVFMLRELPASDALSAIIIGMGINALVGFPFIFSEIDFSANVMLLILALGVIQMGLAYIFFTEGLKHTAPLTASFLGFAEPVLCSLWAFLSLGELPAATACAGAAVVLVSILCYYILKNKQIRSKCYES